MKVLTTNEIKDFVPEELRNRLDPTGKHLLVGPSLLHNDTEVRQMVLLKVRGKMGPVESLATIPLEMYNAIPEYQKEGAE